MITKDGAFEGGLVQALNVLCPDGQRRNALPSGDGTADTFFSIPAFVYAKVGTKATYGDEGSRRSVRVYGYVTTDCGAGVEDIRFVPYTYRKNHDAVCHPPLPDDNTCLNCGKETMAKEGSPGSYNRTHVETDDFFCNPERARQSDWNDGAQAHLRTHAEVRESDAYKVRSG